MLKKLLAAALVSTAAVAATAVPGVASARDHADGYVLVQYGPPPPLRHEVVPPPRRGYVWVPGHWQWRGHRHYWVPGHWIAGRPGYRYYGPSWAERDGRWHYRPGYWGRGDRDRDGVPDRFDRRPGNPYRS